MTLKSVLITWYARYHPWPVFAIAVVLSIVTGVGAWLLPGKPIGAFGWWFSGASAGIAAFLLFEPWRSNRRQQFFEQRIEARDRANETAIEKAIVELADEHTQELADKLRKDGVTVEVLNGELIFPDRSGQRAI